MKHAPLFLTALLFFTGCVGARLARLTQPEGRYAPAIHAAGSIGFSPDRAATLRDIAGKTDLTDAEQIYLLEVLEIAGGFSGDKKKVLLALLSNRSVTAPTRKRISEILPKLGLFSGDAKAVADALAG